MNVVLARYKASNPFTLIPVFGAGIVLVILGLFKELPPFEAILEVANPLIKLVVTIVTGAKRVNF